MRLATGQFDQYGEVLRLAASSQQWELCRTLLDKGTPVVAVSGRDSALHGFVRNNQLELVKKAVQSPGCNINCAGYNEKSALDMAVINHSVSADILEVLLSQKDIDRNKKLAYSWRGPKPLIFHAIKTKQAEKVALLTMDPRTDLSFYDYSYGSLVMSASEQGYGVLKAFLSARPITKLSKKERCESLIFHFIENNQIDLINLYLENSPDFLYRERNASTVLVHAVKHYNTTTKTLNYLLTLLPNYDFDQEKTDDKKTNLIESAISCGNLEKVEILIKAGAPVSLCRNCSPYIKNVLARSQ